MAPENVLAAQNLNTGLNAVTNPAMISPSINNPSMNNRGHPSASNDNAPETPAPNTQDATQRAQQEQEQLSEALKLFAEHGIMAGKRAQAKALEASTLGKTSEYVHWHAICHKLDRKLAADLTNGHIDRSAG